jgi:hypothetical protein
LLEQGVFGVGFASSKSICFICKAKGGAYALGAFALAQNKSKCFFLFIPLNNYFFYFGIISECL